MTMVERKSHTGWRGMAGILLFAALAFYGAGHHAWAEEDAEHIVDGRNPNDFENRGQIDRMDGDVIVINDLQKRLASNVKYYRPGRVRIPKAAFEEGSKVGYITNRKGEITSLWLLKPSQGVRGHGQGQGQGGSADHSDEKGRKPGSGG